MKQTKRMFVCIIFYNFYIDVCAGVNTLGTEETTKEGIIAKSYITNINAREIS
jgi:hypothetical protein